MAALSSKRQVFTVSEPPPLNDAFIQRRKSVKISVYEKDNDDESTTTTTATSFSSVAEEGDHRAWGNRLDFIMSCISFAVGLGNVWRFPYKCFKNGGGAFLIPYFICWLVVAIPMFYFETSLGQQFQLGGVGVWRIVPIFKGIGLASVIIVSLVSTYYAIVIAWAFLYFFSSLNSVLPWRYCGHSWNTLNCINETVLMDQSMPRPNGSETSTNEFWTNMILGKTDDISDTGSIQWYLLGTLTLTWILVYLIICKGLHSSGKIVWFTALFPYILIFILLGYICTLPGMSIGLEYYLTPKIEKLKSATVWVEAGTQVMYSYGIGFSSLIAMGCYNKYHHNNQRDALIIGAINSGTSLLAGVVVFGSLGYAVHVQNRTIEEVAEQGPGLIFQVYPQIFLEMPVSPLWASLFFLMVVILGIDSQFCQVEGVMAGLEDQWPKIFKLHKKKATAIVCLLFYFLGWPMIDQGGIYLFQLMDNMSASGPPLLWVVFWEVIAVCWFYGIRRFARGLRHMIGHKSTINITIYWWTLCWTVGIPAIMLGIFLFSCINYEPTTYKKYVYPKWGEALGWMIALASMIMIPGYWVFFLIRTPGPFMKRLEKGVTCKLEPRYMTEEHQDIGSTFEWDLGHAAEKGSEIPHPKRSTVQPIAVPHKIGSFENILDAFK